jgi:PDZ domain
MRSHNNRPWAPSESGSTDHARWWLPRLGLCFFIVMLGSWGLASWAPSWRAQSNHVPEDLLVPVPAPRRTVHKVPTPPDPAPTQAESSTTQQHRAEVRDLAGRLVNEPILLISANCKTSRSIHTPQFSQPLSPSERDCAFFVLYSHDGWSVASAPRTFNLDGRTTVFVLPIEADPNGEIVVSRGDEGLGIVESSPESILSKMGLTPGDRITQVNGASGGALSIEELLQAFDLEKGERVLLTISRGEGDTALEEIELRGLGVIE